MVLEKRVSIHFLAYWVYRMPIGLFCQADYSEDNKSAGKGSAVAKGTACFYIAQHKFPIVDLPQMW